jgi:hypothetical protein
MTLRRWRPGRLESTQRSDEWRRKPVCRTREAWFARQRCGGRRIVSGVTTTGGFFGFFCVLYSTLLHLPSLRFHCVGGCWDRIQDCCDFGIGSQTHRQQPFGVIGIEFCQLSSTFKEYCILERPTLLNCLSSDLDPTHPHLPPFNNNFVLPLSLSLSALCVAGILY